VTLPPALRGPVETAIAGAGAGTRVTATRPVTGGCIHHGTRLETDAGVALFLKWSDGTAPGMFDAEADGLVALRRAGAARVPEPLAWKDGGPEGPSWLLMEYVDPGPAGATGRKLGEAVARLHGAGMHRGGPAPEVGFGWSRDNWIGSLPQANPPAADWAAFWRDRRLLPQLGRARAQGRLADDVLDRAAELAGRALGHVRSPELIHGDLWSGNTFHDAEGVPVLIDPAVCRGDGEVDLAMSELFGGFGADFYAAYDAVRPISPEYHAYARDLYQLYYLLVHVNLFGASYEAGTLAAARRAVAGAG
jgi:protein-ribulosamine 3-kinase